MEAIGGAVENQRAGTPHYHFNAHVVSAYQHMTMAEIAALVEAELLRPEDLHDFHTGTCREEQFNQAQHEADLDRLEIHRPDYAGAEHHGLCSLPAYLAKDESSTMWDAEAHATEAAARVEGLAYKKKYFADAQFVFSRRQHHWHRRGKHGEMLPLAACLIKGKLLVFCWSPYAWFRVPAP